MPEALEAIEVHFFQSALRGPVLECNAICGDEHSGTVVAKPAMNIESFSWLLLKKRKELYEFFVFWWRPAASANVDEAHAMLLRALSFGGDGALAFAAKINNGGDADFFQLFDASFIRLRAAVEEVVDLAHVGNAAQVDFFGEGRSRGISRNAGASGMRAARSEKRCEKQSKEVCA